MLYYGIPFVGFPAMVVYSQLVGKDQFITRQQVTINYIELLLREREPFV